MKASVIHEFGDVDVLKYENIETPKPKKGHILIKINAAGVNRFEHYVREGSIVPELPFPHILGADAQGEVAEIGEGVTGFKIGEKVIPIPGYPIKEEDYNIRPIVSAPSFVFPGLTIPGTYAQYIEVPSKWVLKDITGLKPEETATLPIVLGTSVRSVKEVGQVKKGDNVLIQSGASGSGSMQIQVAKALGAQVATTVRSDKKAEFAINIGADVVINTKNDDFVKVVKDWTGGVGVDVVIDNLGGDVFAKSIDAVRPLGVVVAYGFAAGTEVRFDIRNLFFGQKQVKGSMSSDIEDLEWGLELVKTGKIKPLLDKTLPLKEAPEAHRLISENKVSGNIVLLPWVN